MSAKTGRIPLVRDLDSFQYLRDLKDWKVTDLYGNQINLDVGCKKTIVWTSPLDNQYGQSGFGLDFGSGDKFCSTATGAKEADWSCKK